MNRLIQKDEQGNWSLKGVKWENLYEGQTITKEIRERLYGALWKLMEYENTELEPEEIISLNKFENGNGQKLLLEIAKHKWIPVEERLPENDDYILLSFKNFSLPMIGRYEENENGGVFYLGDCNEEDTCIENDLFVNAWMYLPEPYRQDRRNGKCSHNMSCSDCPLEDTEECTFQENN